MAMSIFLAIMGTSIYYDRFHWVPIISVILYMLVDPIGLGSIPYLYTAEFYPSEMRSVLSGLTIGISNLELFLAVKTFPDLSNALGGIHGSLWLYAGVCFLACIFVAVFIPETKGSTLQDIENYFGRKESLSVTPFQTPMNTPGLSKKRISPISGTESTIYSMKGEFEGVVQYTCAFRPQGYPLFTFNII
ncbi:unnamed protein product [Lepeophtheirus salmonis]|uniref:(salmon louse) hypothetical protein n=1 Tax=Lepeophtheirus salmonis TaxID=72036 RepID=A0A7R8CWX3_LEPSM|nr:unnamed protein product [Lepeophtheirus salmonis]CAF2956216.1 unnamed protein product [Lepeophtheirus salmonis]